MSVGRFLILRRRTDPLLLTAAMALIGVLVSLGKGLFALIAVVGVVHAVIRPSSWRLAPPAFTIVLAAYVAWSIGLSLLRGEGFDGNRLLSYAAIELACVFLPLGLFFVRRPLDAMILGARIGVVALLIATPAEFWATGIRVGLGRNEAILGFIAAAFGLVARLPMERPPRILPNGRWWLYLSFVPALLSQTRATWGIYPIFGILDLVHVWRRVVGVGDRRSVVALAIGACVAVAALLPMSGIVMQRADQALVEIDRYEQTGVASGSVDVRMAMWSSAFEIWREHPLIGIGHVGKMETVAERSGVNEAQVGQYTHLHNLIVDEALNSGIVGTLLLVGVFGVFIGTVFVRSRNTMLRETSVVFVVLVFSYGSFHGVLLNEWMVTVIFGYMSVTLTDLRRKQLGARLRAEIGRA